MKAGTKVSVQAIDGAGNVSASAFATVKDKTAPKLLQVNKFTVKSTYVKGKIEPNAQVSIKVGSKVIGSGKAGKSGTFSVKVKKQKLDTTLKIYLKDSAGNTSKAIKLKVKKK